MFVGECISFSMSSLIFVKILVFVSVPICSLKKVVCCGLIMFIVQDYCVVGGNCSCQTFNVGYTIKYHVRSAG